MPRINDAEKFILHYDELTENNRSVPVQDYYDQLIKWGTSPEKASEIIRKVNPEGRECISRNDICRAVKYDPKQRDSLKGVKIVYCDMPTTRKNSITMHFLQLVSQNMDKSEMLQQLKTRLETVYGGDWSCFVTEGRYWARHSYKPSLLLIFAYQGTVYGVHGVNVP
ncbi:hypothetical protein Aperf_G00000071597 [Anoplocephala perfoliata]